MALFSQELEPPQNPGRFKTLELSKGKNAIELSTGDELLSTLSMLKDAVIAGELDDVITNASDNLRAGFSK